MRKPWTVILWAGLAIISFSIGSIFSGGNRLGDRLRSEGRIQQLGFGLRIYHDQHGEFPPTKFQPVTNGPVHSWRVLLAPMTGGNSDYDFDQEWNSSHNLGSMGSDWSVWFRMERGADEAECLAVSDDDDWPSELPLGAFMVRIGEDRFLLVYDPDSKIHWMEPKH
jgi:hypothetical protein